VTPTTPRILISRKTPGEFKVCPLCGALNVKENDSCCECSWQGKFETGAEAVQVRMWQMVDTSPELQLLLLKELRTPWWKKLWSMVRTKFRRKGLDIRA
jgi:hypothetical protein